MTLLYVLFSYLMGSVSGSLLLGKFWKIDIRGMGSGNAGGTNALRTVGVLFALLTFIIDLSKGIIPTYLSQQHENLMLISGFSAMLGHVYPIFYNFKGGKGAGTLIGVLGVLFPFCIPFALLSWFLVLVLTGYVGLGTMVSGLAVVLVAIQQGLINTPFGYFSIFMALFVIFTHRSNIYRMLKGEENQFKKIMWFKK